MKLASVCVCPALLLNISVYWMPHSHQYETVQLTLCSYALKNHTLKGISEVQKRMEDTSDAIVLCYNCCQSCFLCHVYSEELACPAMPNNHITSSSPSRHPEPWYMQLLCSEGCIMHSLLTQRYRLFSAAQLQAYEKASVKESCIAMSYNASSQCTSADQAYAVMEILSHHTAHGFEGWKTFYKSPFLQTKHTPLLAGTSLLS